MQNTTAEPLAPRLSALAATDAALARLRFDWRLDTLLRPRLFNWRNNRQAPLGAEGGAGLVLVWSSPQAQLRVTVPDALDVAATAVVKATAWPEPVRLASLELILRDSMGSLAEWATDLGLRLTAASDSIAPASSEPGAATLAWRYGKHSVSVHLHSDDAAWVDRALIGLGSAAPRLATVARVNMPAVLALGWRRIGVGTLRTLAVGDVLLAAHAKSVHLIDQAFLVIGHSRHRTAGRACRVEGRQITLTGEHWMSEQAMTETALAHSDGETVQPGAADPLASIEVDLHLELQVLSIPMGELANMRHGYVLELPITATDATVELVVGGQVFGRAQLVCIGDRLGARITELNHDAG